MVRSALREVRLMKESKPEPAKPEPAKPCLCLTRLACPKCDDERGRSK